MKFKVGDRVRAYYFSQVWTGKIIAFFKDRGRDFATVQFLSGRRENCPVQWLRLLKKKKRREIWVHPVAISHGKTEVASSIQPGWIHFVESKRK